MDTNMYIKVTVRAGSKEDAVTEKNGRYIILTRERAENGRANTSAHMLLARYLGIPHKNLALVRGSDRPSKLFIRNDV